MNRNVTGVEDPRDGSEIDDNSPYQRVIVGSSSERTLIPEQEDPFQAEATVLKTMGGVNATLRKRASRKIEKVHSGTNGAESTKREFSDYTGYDLFEVVEPPYNLGYLAKLYVASSPHYAAVNAKTANIVGLGYDFVESPQAQDKFDDAATDDEKAKLSKKMRKIRQAMFDRLDSCHQEDDFLETLRKIYVDYEATGNGYMEIGRSVTGEVAYLGHIDATSMRVRKRRDGFVQVVEDKAVFFRHFGTDTADPIGDGVDRVNEVIHFKKYCPGNNYYGVPDIIAATQAVAGNEFAARFNLDYFENKAVPRYVIVIKGGKLSARSENDIVTFFETGLRGKNHRTLFVPLPADTQESKVSFEMKPVEAGTQDASFVNYNKINLASIFMAHRTPASKTGYADSGQSLAAARDADKTFKEGVCRPEQKVFEKKLKKIFSEWTNAFLFKLNELTLTDEDTQSKIDERGIRNQWIVPNEIRARNGMTGLKGGDKVVELKPQVAADQKAKTSGTKTRDQARSANATDSAGQGRSAKGDGRTTP